MSNTKLQHNYVISLTTAKERREHIIQEFGKQNIPFEFFDAITPDLIEEKVKEFNIDISKTNLTQGELACALSHIAVWRLAQEKNLDYVCVFEDDIFLGENSSCFLTNDYIPVDVDIVKFEKNLDIIETSKKAEKTVGERAFYQLKSTHAGAAGYLVTKKGLDYLLTHISALEEVEIDNLLFKQFLADKNYCVWQLLPAICIQSAISEHNQLFQTTISGRDDRNKKLKKKSSFLQKIQKELSRIMRKIRFALWGKEVTFK